MISVAKRPLRAGIMLLVFMLAALVGAAWAIQKSAVEHLLHANAVSTAQGWAGHLARNIDDLAAIAQGKTPSPASMAFLERVQKAGHVFRYKIFDPEGRLLVASDELRGLRLKTGNARERSLAAPARAAGRPLVIARTGTPPEQPSFFAEAYVPVTAAGKTIAIVQADVDQTEKRDHFLRTFTLGAVALSVATMFAFGVPAAAWYHRAKEKHRAEERVRFLAYYDALTGLPNRNRLMEQLQQGCAATAREGSLLALHVIDLDHFRNVNDTLDHDAGDSLLKVTAERLLAVTGPHALVARCGGDEFAVLQFDIEERSGAEQMARRLLDILAQPVVLNGHEIAPSASIGVAVAPDDGDTPARLLECADLAVYKCKAEGRHRIRFFAASMDSDLQARLKVEQSIRNAVFSDAFELYFQPVVELPGGRLVGCEALLRMRAEDGRFIPPDEFVPVAEEMGLIGRIGAWVIREACRIATTWPDHLTVAINLSPAQFATGSVHDLVTAALAETRLDPHRLELDISENVLLDDSGTVAAELGKLKALGVGIAMDDFGTGYASLSHLWRFAFGKIKIDRSFVLGLDKADQDVETILKTIVEVGRSLGMRVAAEGIETARHADLARAVQCDEAQGFYFGRPVPVNELPALIAADAKSRLPRQAGMPAAGTGAAPLRTATS